MDADWPCERNLSFAPTRRIRTDVFQDLNWDEPGFDHSTFSRNRARLLKHDVAGEFFRVVVEEARGLKLTSDEHYTVDGT